jgi:hypothetical protein
MQVLSPVEANRNVGIEELLTDTWLYRVVLYASLAYHTIATKIRLSVPVEGNIPKVPNKCKIFYLYGIKLAFELVPFLTDYHQQIL